MTKLYKKSEILFAILWIVAYVVLSSLADQLSESIGVVKSVTAALHIFLSLILFFWIRNNHLSEKYGFCKSAVPAKKLLYYLPLAVVASTPFWGRSGLQYDEALQSHRHLFDDLRRDIVGEHIVRGRGRDTSRTGSGCGESGSGF